MGRLITVTTEFSHDHLLSRNSLLRFSRGYHPKSQISLIDDNRGYIFVLLFVLLLAVFLMPEISTFFHWRASERGGVWGHSLLARGSLILACEFSHFPFCRMPILIVHSQLPNVLNASDARLKRQKTTSQDPLNPRSLSPNRMEVPRVHWKTSPVCLAGRVRPFGHLPMAC